MRQLWNLPALLLAVLLPLAAQAQTCPSGWGCVNVFSRNNTWSGTNAATGLGAYTPSTAECPSAAGTLTPAHNVVQCVMAGNITMALPSPFTPYQPIIEVLTENATGGFTLTPCTACKFPSSMINANGQVAISTAANSENEVQCTTVTVASTNEMHCTVAAGFGAPSSPITITAHGVGTQCSGSGVTTCAGPALSASTGQLLAVESWVCGSGCGAAPTTVSSVTGTGLSCAAFTIAGTKANAATAVDAYLCNVTAGGTVTPTVNYAGTGYYGFVWAQAISNAVGDDGIGNATTFSGTNANVPSNGNTTRTTGNGDLCVSIMTDSGAVNLTLGQTALDYIGNHASGSQSQNAGTTPVTVTATGTYASSINGVSMVACLK